MQNTKKCIIRGSANLEEALNTEGSVVFNYSANIKRILNIFYVKKIKKLVFLTDAGEVFYLSTLSEKNNIENIKELDEHNWGPYIYLAVATDEKSIILQSQSTIFIYDLYFNLYIQFSIPDQVINTKIYVIEENLRIIFQSPTKLNCTTVTIPQVLTIIEQKKNGKSEKLGNPGIDVWQSGYIKFGKIIKFDSRNEPKNFRFFTINDDFRLSFINYINDLKCFKKNYSFEDIQNLNIIDRTLYISKRQFISTANTRIPIHLASAQQGNLFPLQNGINIVNTYFEQIKGGEGLVNRLLGDINFGYIEELIKLEKDIIVVSIFGEQSSGKSYFLNRLFNTRFDVSALSCTHGIWMSLAYIEDKCFLVLDSEGLFTVKRSADEQWKISLFLIAISDIIFLKLGLDSNRNIIELFANFSKSDKIFEEKNLFKGALHICMKDVGEDENENAEAEFNNFLSKVNDSNSRLFKDLFNEEIIYNSYHNHEHKKFIQEINEKRSSLREIKSRFSNSKELVDTIKALLIKIYTDHQSSIDSTLNAVHLNELKSKAEKIINNKASNSEKLQPDFFSFKFRPNDKAFIVDFDIWNSQIDKTNNIDPILNKMQEEISKEIILQNYNKFYHSYSKFLQELFEIRKESILNYFINQAKKIGINDASIEYEKLTLLIKLEQQQNNYRLCLRACDKCFRVCILTDRHEMECSCETNHKCSFNCEFCIEDPVSLCNLDAGHGSSHICNSTQHRCLNHCMIKNCKNQCIKKPGHASSCICSKNFHECQLPCLMHSFCHGKCSKDINNIHEDHNCNMTRCPFQCLLCKNFCINSNHMHELTDTETVINPFTNQTTKLHLCGTTHLCPDVCSLGGICDLKLKKISRVYKNEFNEINYFYVEQLPKTNKCTILIPSGLLYHNERHQCSVLGSQHKCKEKCPDCSCYCTNPVGHTGLHASYSHRNKEKCIFISTKNQILRDIEDFDQVITTKIFKPGESSTPEHCDSNCFRKGRGHAHPWICDGGNKCLEKLYRGYAKHSTDKYCSGGIIQDYIYDFVECRTFWRLFGWQAPIETKRPEAQDILGKCNAFCLHESHDKTLNTRLAPELSFCNSNIFHTDSLTYADHSFSCKHTDIESHDVILILDITGSMNPYQEPVKNTVEELIRDWGAYDTKFGFVGYTDHENAIGEYLKSLNKQEPFVCYPENKNIGIFDLNELIEFIKSVEFDGGGYNGGEAMIDGLNAALQFKKRKNARTVYVIIGDDSPHGREFNEASEYPDGCPCNISWKKVLDEMKNSKAVIIFVKLTQILDKTVELFNRQYDNKIRLSELQDVKYFQQQVGRKISVVIQTDLEFSLKYLPKNKL